VDDGPVAAAAEHGLAGPALDTACRAVLALPPHPAIAVPAWWDANAAVQRVTYVPHDGTTLPPAPWPAHRALAFCAELAGALAPVHAAGVAHGALRPDAVALRPDGGPLVRLPGGDASPADDLHGVGILLLHLLTGRDDPVGLVIAGEVGPAAEAAALLQGLLADDPAGRPVSARAVGERLGAIAAAVPDTTPEPAPPPLSRARRRARVAAGVALLAVALAAGGYLASNRVGPPGPALSPTTVTVPEAPAVSP
jgi:eukaryotic-like serine/threonine-protein kinase